MSRVKICPRREGGQFASHTLRWLCLAGILVALVVVHLARRDSDCFAGKPITFAGQACFVDYGMLVPGADAVADLDFREVFTSSSVYSTPGYQLASGLLTAMLRPIFGTAPTGHTAPTSPTGHTAPTGPTGSSTGAAEAVAVAASILLVIAAVRLGRAAGVEPLSRAELFLAALVTAVPALTQATTDYFHPQDVLGLALIIFSLTAVIRDEMGAWLRAAIWLGLALFTRQWAILAVPAIVLGTPAGRRLRLVLVATGLCAAGLLPFILIDGSDLLRALAATELTYGTDRTLIELLPIPRAFMSVVARYGPVVATSGLGVVAWWSCCRHGKRLVVPSAVLGLAMAGVATRLIFDLPAYPYYPLATSVLLVVLVIATRRSPLLALGWIVADPLARELVAPPAFAFVEFSLCMLVIVFGMREIVKAGGCDRPTIPECPQCQLS